MLQNQNHQGTYVIDFSTMIIELAHYFTGKVLIILSVCNVWYNTVDFHVSLVSRNSIVSEKNSISIFHFVVLFFDCLIQHVQRFQQNRHAFSIYRFNCWKKWESIILSRELLYPFATWIDHRMVDGSS